MKLNISQRKIITSPFSPTLVIAEAGTGKTMVLTERILHLIKNNIPPTQILAITFTNFAADEIKKRVKSRIKDHRKIPAFIGTIHSFCSEILRRDISHLNTSRNHNFELIQEDLQIDIYRRVSSEKLHKMRAKPVLEMLTKWKMSELIQDIHIDEIELVRYEKHFKEYQKYLDEKNFLDFDDILIFTLKLFEANEEVWRFWQSKFSAILVDECQDLNEIQWRIIKKLLPDNPEKSNFFAVGDPNQCIYIFNGAKEDIFDEFRDYFPNLSTFSLIENYRSGKEIVELSNLVKQIKDKTAVSLSDKKSMVVECESIEEAMLNLLEKKSSSDWAVLFPKKFHSNELVAFLIDRDISFRTSHFYLLEDRDIQNVVNMLRIIFFDNSLPLRFVLMTLNISEHAKKELINKDILPIGTTLFDFFISKDEWKKLPLNSNDMVVLDGFIQYVRNIRAKSLSNLSLIYRSILDYFGIEIVEEERFNKYNLFEKWLINLQKDLKEDDSVMDIILNLESYSFFRKDDINKDSSNFVTLSTIHKAKGLEWNNVIVLEKQFLEEEKSKGEQNKNLLYVAISRAKEKLILVK